MILLALGLVIAVVVARLVFTLPDISARPAVNAIAATKATQLGSMMLNAGATAQSGVYPLADGVDALRARLDLVAMAEESIDLQYYIWHDDVSGNLLLDALNGAAQRGVRVRMLLDDNGIPGLDSTIAALAAQPNFDIRLFNPSVLRRLKMASFVFDFFRMNRRMHNKSFLVDGAAAIIGGRNIGDEYFKIAKGSYFVDLDVLAVGPIVPEAAQAFDSYWNSASVFDATRLIDPDTADLPGHNAAVAEARMSEAAQLFTDENDTIVNRYKRGDIALEWTKVALVVDDPIKGTGGAHPDQLMISRLGAILGDIKSKVDLVSPYFIPGQQGSDWFSNLAKQGVTVKILTNALTTTDVVVVHAGYIKYRRSLLDAGVNLYELKPIAGAPRGSEELNKFGLSGASLHAKTFAVDDRQVFIGSFNFDPRSASLNCEMGLLIESPRLASIASQGFDARLPIAAYQPRLNDGTLQWIETTEDGTSSAVDREPGATPLDNLAMTVLGWLPIEWML